MREIKFYVKDFVSILPMYVNLDDTLDIVLEKMLYYRVLKLTVCDKDFNIAGNIAKSEISSFLINKEQEIDLNTLKKYCASDVLNKEKKCAIAFFGSSLSDIVTAMRVLNIEYIPVVKSPWNKRLKGFLELREIQKVMEVVAAY